MRIPTRRRLVSSVGIELLEARIAPAFGAVFELSSLDGSNGFKLSGGAAGDLSGRSVSDAGDVNGDGFGDVIIGAFLADPNGDRSGASYVIFGKASGFSTNLNLSTLDGSNGFKVSGVAANDRSGRSVSAAGDINGDGFGDVLIGAYYADANGSDSGASYVVFGKASGFAASLNLSALDGSNGFKLSGVAAGDLSGSSGSGAGDVNGDGFGDLIIGAYGADPGGDRTGATYVVFGKAGGFSGNLNLSMLDGSNGFKLIGVAPQDFSGLSVSGAGDVNGDGFADVIIGAQGADSNDDRSGASYVVFGKASGFLANISLSTLDGSNGFKLSGVALQDFAGNSVSDAGDVNGDGFGDLIIGAFGVDPNGTGSGGSYVIFGRAGGFSANLDLSAVDGSNGFQLSGVAVGDYAGRSVSDAGDVNGDGFGDLIIGASDADPHGKYSGASYVVFGKASGFAANLNLSTLDGTNGFKLSGVAMYDDSGRSVSAAGDVNGDGFSDLLIGAFRADPNGSYSGASYVVFGRGAELTINDASAIEGNAGTTTIQFTVSLSEAGNIPVSVRAEAVDGSALSNIDFAAFETTITFAPGETSKTMAIDVTGDTIFEGDETFSIELSDATGGVIRDGTAVGTIRNDDVPPAVSVAGGSVLEGDGGTSVLAFTVSLSEVSGLPAAVNFASIGGTAVAGSDYTTLEPGTLTFAPGEMTKTISLQVLGDVEIEDHENFSLILSEPSGATIGTGMANGTIRNDDTAVRIADAGSLLEGDSGTALFGFAVTLEKASALSVIVHYTTIDGTAAGGSDFNPTPDDAQLMFAPGETSKLITIEALSDDAVEDHETFSVVLSTAANAVIANSAGTATILNDDAVITIGDGTAREGDSGTTNAIFTVTLEKASALFVSVNYATADGTAIAGSDYGALSPGTVTFEPGETTKTIVVDLFGDGSVEAHETFSVILSSPANATIANGTARGTILNDDALVRITDASLLEGHAGTRAMTFDVSLSAASALPVRVNFTSADGTAASGADYTSLAPGSLEFAPGETSKTLSVDILGDIVVEASETFSIGLADASNAIIDDGVGIGTILDDDVTLVGARKATFTDVDGELVTIKVSTGTLKVEDFTIVPRGQGAQLALVDFSGEPEFAGLNLKIFAKKLPGGTAGDRLVNVGQIDAIGIDLGKVRIKGDLGQIDAGDELARAAGLVALSTSSIGRSGLATQLPGGSLQSDIVGALKTLKLAGDLQDATLSVSGGVGAVTIKGSVLGGAIRSDAKIGSVEISGDLAASAMGEATISAQGLIAPTTIPKALAIGRVSIGGSVTEANILAGYDRTGTGTNPDVGIGTVSIGGIWMASDLVAGVAAGPDGFFGTDDDTLISEENPIVASIAAVVIKGLAAGTESSGDHFGFVAERIGAFKAGGIRLTLETGPGNDLGLPVGATGDLKVREIV